MECKCLRFVLFLLTCNNFSLAVVSSHSGRNDSSESIANTSWSSDGVPDFPSLCPYNKYCTSSPLKHIPSTDLTSCCQTCSCDVDCYEIGNCCPDAPFTPAGKVKYPCVRIYEDNLYYSDDNVWYHVIAKCKDTFNALAHPRCYKPTELQDLVVVSENGRVYKNKHCAICNDVHNYTNWILKTDCPDMLLFDFKAIEDRDKQIFENRDNCTLYSIPPDSKDGEMSRCSPDSSLITTCNVTWDWDVYDKGIEDACHSNRKHQNVLFTQDLHGSVKGVTKYANVYCYICNRQRHLKRIDLCIHEDYDMGSSKSWSLEFTGIIDVQTGVNQVDLQDFDCKQQEVWDPFSRICRQLICPVGTFPLYGSCRSTLSQSQGYLVLINFEVIIDNLALSITNKTILTILEKRMLPMFGHRCRLAESALMNVNKSFGLILSLIVYSTETCPTETILANTRKIVMKKYIRMKIRHKDQRFQLLLGPVFGYSFDGNVDIFAINSYHSIRYVNRLISSSIVYYCPSIKLTREEISSFGLNNALNMTSAKSEENIVSTTICIDTYFKARKTASDTASNHRRNNVLFWFQTLVILICMGLL